MNPTKIRATALMAAATYADFALGTKDVIARARAFEAYLTGEADDGIEWEDEISTITPETWDRFLKRHDALTEPDSTYTPAPPADEVGEHAASDRAVPRPCDNPR